MQEVIQFLQENPVQYLATVGRDGRAKCRPFMFSGELDGKLWFCTNHTKEVYQDMQRNPYIEITTSSPEYAWLRLSGEATFENNMAAKECVCATDCQGTVWRSGQPHFRGVLSQNAHAVLADFFSNPPKEYTL